MSYLLEIKSCPSTMVLPGRILHVMATNMTE
jgi:hypothetical protein